MNAFISGKIEKLPSYFPPQQTQPARSCNSRTIGLRSRAYNLWVINQEKLHSLILQVKYLSLLLQARIRIRAYSWWGTYQLF